MEEEKEITQRLWSGCIPLELRLAPADAVELMASPTLPEPFQTFYILAPRGSYLPFLTKKIKEQWLDPLWTLGTSIHSGNITKEPINEGDFWMEVDGVPLKWHYPIGLLYDIHANAIPGAQKVMRVIEEGGGSTANLNSNQFNSDGDNVSIPWCITLHLRKFPSDRLIRSPSSQTMRDMYMFMVKEADYLRFGSTKRVMDLSKTDQTQLLDGLESHSFEQYHSIHTLLSSPPNLGDSPNNGLPRHIPIRWYILPKGSFQPDHATIVQDLVSPVHSNSPSAKVSNNNKPSTNSASSGSGKPANGAWVTLLDAFNQAYPDAFATTGNDNERTPDTSRWKYWCQGIQPPWDTPIIWLSSNLAYPDGFLHFVLVETQ